MKRPPLTPRLIACYNKDIKVKRKAPSVLPPPAKRSEIYQLSKKSMAKLAFVANNTSVVFDTLVTLTYPRSYPSDGKTVKRHLNAFLTFLRREVKGVNYLWFLEFQLRGAPHIHMFYDRRGIIIPKTAVAERWFAIVDSADDRHLKAGTRVEAIRLRDGAARYATKYATKQAQKIVPKDYRNVGRFWGHSKGVKPTPKKVMQIRDNIELGELLGDWEHRENFVAGGWSVGYGVSEKVLDNMEKLK